MRRLFTILVCFFGMMAYAADNSPLANSSQAVMQSVNSGGYMSSGSQYSSTVYAVGASTPSAAPVTGPRKSGFGDISTGEEVDSEEDPNNPSFAPVGDAFIPLLLMALMYAMIALRRTFS